MTHHEVVAVVTSMGRRRHLEQTLPALLARTAFSAVLVDWSCPQDSGGFAESLRSRRVHVVRVPGQRLFNLARARNAGARSPFVRSLPGDPVLAFLDADMLVPRSGSVIQRAAHLLPSGAAASCAGFGGLLLVHRSLYERSGGYDERFEGWAPEDVEMRVRLHLMGASPVLVPRSALPAIQHGDHLRTENYGGVTRRESLSRGMDLADRALSERFGTTLRAFLETPDGAVLSGRPPRA